MHGSFDGFKKTNNHRKNLEFEQSFKSHNCISSVDKNMAHILTHLNNDSGAPSITTFGDRDIFLYESCSVSSSYPSVAMSTPPLTSLHLSHLCPHL